MGAILDPWADAALIARQLAMADCRFVAAVGSQSCLQCSFLHEAFCQFGRSAPACELWLWLWQEEHGEFLQGLERRALPQLWVYRGHQLLRCGQPEPDAFLAGAEALLQSVSLYTSGTVPFALDLRARLLVPDWA